MTSHLLINYHYTFTKTSDKWLVANNSTNGSGKLVNLLKTGNCELTIKHRRCA